MQELVVPIMISLIESCCLKGSYWTKCSYCLSWSHDLINQYDHGYVPFVVFFNHNQNLSLFITYHRVCNKINSCGTHPLPHQTSSPVFLPVLVELMLLMLTHVFMSSCFKFRVVCPVQFALWGVQVLIMLIVFIYVCWCPTRFPYHMMFASFNSYMTGATCGAGNANPCEAHEFTPVFSGVRVSRSSVFFIMFCRSLLVLFRRT